jgi:sortase A
LYKTMRKFGIIFIGILVVLGVFLAWNKQPQSAAFLSPVKQNEIIPVKGVQDSEVDIRTASFDQPRILRVSSLNIEATIESVGLDEKRSMDVPKAWENVAWYNLGYRPGEIGNAVIAGHFDAPDGGPAVFYKLKDLQPGQEIIVTDQNDNELTFIITESKTYDFDSFPIKTVFGESETPRLNLITCEGIFNREEKNYSQRTVVFSELKK